MRIEENRVYVFTFNTGDHGDLSIPVRGQSHAEAAANLQAIFARMQTELALEFPKVASGAIAGAGGAGAIPAATDGLSEILLERIDKLMSDMGGKDLTGDAKAKTIKTWTELEFVPENYSSIVHALELIASGQSEIPAKPKKK